MDTYQPAEDSHLLAEAVKKLARGRVLDMGTGSGIQAEAALKSSKVKSVTAADINKSCGKNLSSEIKFIHSDLFKKIPKQKFDMSETQSVSEHDQNRHGSFDTIIFNPPYLPQDRRIRDVAIYGGKKGYETTERFLGSCSSYLAGNGIILLLFSNLTKKEKIDEIIENNCLEKEELSRKELPFFETLYVYRIRKSLLLLQLGKKGIIDAKKFAEGNRGVIYTGSWRGRKVAIKAKKADSAAKGTVANEAKWLKILNRKGIGPKLIFSSRGYFAYGFVEGQFIIDYVRGCSREMAVAAIKNILEQCRTLDKLKVNKEEMLRPQRHVIVRDGKPVMIDFERCRKTRKPKNVTQFCQFLAGGHCRELLASKKIIVSRERLLAAAKAYKNRQTNEKFRKVENEVQ